jgi:photosystem II stability/assembly factor-like uncharacterized protein
MRISAAQCVVVALLANAGAFAVTAPAEFADHEPLAARSLLLDAALAGRRMVVVGERGHVLLSDDTGKSWRQAKTVPVRSMLTGVYFIDADRGWAVGQDDVVLSTADGGETWQQQHSAPENQRPLLDVWFADARRGIAVGAYSAMLETTDGGAHWAASKFSATVQSAPAKIIKSDADVATEYHFNRIVPAAGKRLYLAAEAGQLYRSDDAGAHWIALPSPYAGSFYGVLPLPGDAVLAYGLRGNLFRSNDSGVRWQRIDAGTLSMLTDAIVLDAKTVVVVGLAGTVLVSTDGGERFRLEQQTDRKGFSAALKRSATEFVVVGESGVKTIAIE